MSSWRDSASQESQDDLDNLLNAVLPLAQQLLDDAGEFYPYGADITLAGATEMVMGHPGTGGDNPASADVINVLWEGFRTKADRLRAAAIVADFRMAESDAIRVELEHRDGHALVVIMPYRTDPQRQSIEYLELRAGSGSQRIWID